MIEWHEAAIELKGYQGDTRKQKAHIRIKGSGWAGANYVGEASNDLGFERMEDGSYAFHVSDYDQHRYGKAWQDKLMNQYAVEVVKEVAEESNYFIEEQHEENGTIFIKLSTAF